MHEDEETFVISYNVRSSECLTSKKTKVKRKIIKKGTTPQNKKSIHNLTQHSVRSSESDSRKLQDKQTEKEKNITTTPRLKKIKEVNKMRDVTRTAAPTPRHKKKYAC